MQGHVLGTGHAGVVPAGRHAGFVALAAVDLATGETGAARLAGCPTAARIAGRAGPWATGPVRFA